MLEVSDIYMYVANPANLVIAVYLQAESHPSSMGVEGGLLVKALDCRSKGPGFQSHLQQRFISLLGSLSRTPKIE